MQAQNRVSLGLPPKTNVSKQQCLSQLTRFSDHKPTDGGLLGKTAGYILSKGVSKGMGKGVNPLGEMTVAGFSEVSDTLGGGIWETESTPEEDITPELLDGPNDATLGVELTGVARLLRA